MQLPSPSPRLERLDGYLAEQRWDDAMAAIDELLAEQPNDLALLRRRAEILSQAHRRNDALEAWRELARAFARLGYHTRAIELLKRLLHEAPMRADLSSELAQLIAAERHARSLDSSWSEVIGGASPQDKERATSALFTLFSPEVLAEVMDRTERRTFTAGEVIVNEGETGGGMFLLVEGLVKVFTRDPSGDQLPLTELGPGDLFGEVSVLTGAPRTATIVAETAVVALEVSRATIVDIAGRLPEVLDVMQRFCEQRAQHTIETLLKRTRGG